MGTKEKIAKNPSTDGDTLHALAIKARVFGAKVRFLIAAHKNTKPETLDFLAKIAIQKRFVIMELALLVINNSNVSNDTLKWMSELIKPPKITFWNFISGFYISNTANRGNIANRAALILMQRINNNDKV